MLELIAGSTIVIRSDWQVSLGSNQNEGSMPNETLKMLEDLSLSFMKTMNKCLRKGKTPDWVL